MSIENKNGKESLKLTTRTKVALGGIAATVVVLGGAELAAPLSPEFHGQKIHVVDDDETLDGIIKVHVKGGASHTGAVRSEIKSNPDNADVFENNQLDPGEELEIPERVTN